jgi:hypothetical protein
MCSKHMRIFCTVGFKLYVVKDAEEHGNTAAGRHFGPTWTKNVRVGADESLAWLTSRCQDRINSFTGKRGLFMWRIASLFLLQRLKGNMSAMRVISPTLKCELFSSKARHRRIFTPSWQALGEHAPSYVTIKNWVAQYKLGFFHLWCTSSWKTQNSDHPGNYWSNSRVDLGTLLAGFRLRSLSQK